MDTNKKDIIKIQQELHRTQAKIIRNKIKEQKDHNRRIFAIGKILIEKFPDLDMVSDRADLLSKLEEIYNHSAQF